MNQRPIRFYSCALAAVVFTVQPAAAVDVWVTTGDKTQLFKQNTDVLLQPGLGTGGTLINVTPATRFQTIDGFGAAMTDSSAWLLENRMSAPQREKLMRQLFSPGGGVGVNYLRVPIGASDFTASGYYTYNDNPPGGTDPQQAHFSIDRDRAYVIPRLQQAKALNPDLKLMAAPWSAPAWMKTNRSLTGGFLSSQWEAAYANYLTKFVEAYEAEGLPIDLLSIQNEPLHTTNYPTMEMTAGQQLRIIKNNLGPLLASKGLETKVLAYDHNWDNTAYPIEVLNDPLARQYVAGASFHGYAGLVGAQTTFHNAHPDKGVYFTEISGGDFAPNFSDNLSWNLQNIIIGNTRNWGQTGLFWNLALDENHGPHLNGCSDCRGVVTINSTTGDVIFNEEFYALAHITKNVMPGATRIGSTSNATLNTVAFENPDGSRVLVVMNLNAAATTARVYDSGQHFVYQVPGKSAATFRWAAAGADFDNGGFDDGGFHAGGGSLDAWTVFGANNLNVAPSAVAVHSGDKSLMLRGQSTGAPNQSGVSQGITVASNDHVEATFHALVRSTDGLATTANYAEARLQFFSQHGALEGSAAFLGEHTLQIADSQTTTDVWRPLSLSGVAPAGTVEARLVLQLVQPGLEGGSVYLDSVAFGLAPAPQVPGDYNGNGTVDLADFEAWREAFVSQNLAADGNQDGVVDAADYTVWRDLLAPSPAPLTTGERIPEPATYVQALGGLIGVLGAMVYRLAQLPAPEESAHAQQGEGPLSR